MLIVITELWRLDKMKKIILIVLLLTPLNIFAQSGIQFIGDTSYTMYSSAYKPINLNQDRLRDFNAVKNKVFGSGKEDSIYFTDFTLRDWILQGVYTIVTCIDWAQTKKGTENGYREGNPLLGERPSQQKIDTMIGLCILAHAGITYALPRNIRPIWQGLWIGIEYDAIEHNRNQGIRVNIAFGY